ncbi:hypothetical protein [Agriterribacter sp.]|uniref:hypothetical protein n=1 Tax=Agriterribacter sp. TaxID=2821509 RepID=UPI002B9BEFF8|nr:hypothetical protein [Agriterribacter sp.]HRP56123.1 hypothetical protein [Agriterribacter sp.]
MALIIKWNRKALKYFDEAIEYIRSSSPAKCRQSKAEDFISDRWLNGASSKV